MESYRNPALRMEPLENRLVVKRLEADQVTASGIVLASKRDEKFVVGRVMKAGPGRLSHFSSPPAFIPNSIRPGALVVFPSHSGEEIREGDEVFHLLNELEVVGYLTEEGQPSEEATL